MPGLRKFLTLIALGLALAAGPAAAQDIHIEPIPPHVKPQWTPVPNVSGVYYAPNIPTDVFRRGTKYYFYWAGYLYRSSKPRGAWKSVTKVPAWFSEIDPSLFKTAAKEGGPPSTPPPGPPTGPPEGLKPAPPPPAPVPTPEPQPPAPAPEKEGPPAAPGQGPKVM